MKSDICYIVSHGFAARMLLQTDLIGCLTHKGLRVAIISHNARDQNFEIFANNPLVSLAEWHSKISIWDDDYLYKRMYFLEDIKSNTALWEKFHNALFYSKSIHPWKRLRPLYYYFIYELIKWFPGIRRRFLENEGKHLFSEEARDLLNQIEPTLVVSTYPVSIMEAKLLHEAKKQGIETVLHLLSWDNITCKGKFPVLADRFITWGDIMTLELKEFYGIDDQNIVKCGVPHFDEHIRIMSTDAHIKAASQLGLDPGKPYFFFAMSSPRFAPREIDIVEWMAASVMSDKFGADMQLVIRPHPQNVKDFTAKKSWLGRLDRLESDRVKIDYPDMIQSKIRWSMKKADMTRLSALISGCCICFNSGSTISIDALMHDKVVILTSFDADRKLPYWNSARRLKDYTHLKKLINAGGVTTVASFEDLESTVNLYLHSPNKDLAERKAAALKECYKNDGKATERVVEALANMVREVKQ